MTLAPVHREEDLPPRGTFVDPSKLPDVYAMVLDGNCLEPTFMHGAHCVFDRREPCVRGDFVALYRRPEIVPPGEHMAIIKRMVVGIMPGVTFPHRDHPGSEVVPVVIVEMLNPRRQFTYRCSDLLGVHKCTGTVDPARTRIVKMTAPRLKLADGDAPRGRRSKR